MNTNVVRTHGAFKDPKTKADFIDRMMSREFSGDLKDLAVNNDLKYKRIRPNALALQFGASQQTFELVIRKPRGPKEVVVKAGRGRRATTQTVAAAQNPAPASGAEVTAAAPAPARARRQAATAH